MDTDAFGYRGSQRPTSGTSRFNEQSFLVWQILRTIAGARLVEVKAVTNAGGVSPVGFVDVLPLVNQLDGSDNAMPHGVIHNLPYFRLQGGANAVIIDPQVGDIGVAVVEDRDISSVKVNRGPANPGSKRIFDMADGLYLGGFLNGAPTQYVQFSGSGITISSPTKVTISAPNVEVDASAGCAINSPTITLNGNLSQGGGSYAGTSTFNGNVATTGTLTNNGKNVGSTHTHGGVQPGSGNTGAPN
ncbi:TPA: oxidoreductase [Burkholderia multivorans]|uniref:phage baseplate assembly protein n=1 Tax=Burkholderia multivorans TaxID=87883 RepID=UPI000D010219|nr:phage baseplate assembly protein [Burkholderia multivorans]PRD74818.1 oxidoreductase [Burkholderia multivorans]